MATLKTQFPSYLKIIQKVNLILAFALILFGTVMDFNLRQKIILGAAGLLSLWAGLTSSDYVNYGINILLGLLFVFSLQGTF